MDAQPLSLKERIAQLEHAAAANASLSSSASPPHASSHLVKPQSALRPPSPAITLNDLQRAASPGSRSRASSSASRTSPHSPAASPRLPVAHILGLYHQNDPNVPSASPVKSAPTAASSTLLARPTSPTLSRASSPGPGSAGTGSNGRTLEEGLTAQLGGRPRVGSGSALAPTPVRASSPLPSAALTKPSSPAPPLPRRTGSPNLPPHHSIPAESGSRVGFSPESRPTSAVSSSAPKLPPRRSTTLDPLSSSKVSSVPVAIAPPLPRRPSTTSTSTSTTASASIPPPLPQRKPILPVSSAASTSSSASIARPPSSNPSRPSLPAKPTIHDPLSSLLRSASSSSSPASTPIPSSASPVRTSPTRRKTPLGTRTGLNGGGAKGRPMDPRARKRYDRLFEQCLDAVGARSLGGEAEKLDGAVVKRLWERSRLSQAFLRQTWTDALQGNTSCSSLDREAFARGMWLIDEELRRCQRDRQRM
ncbi:hypothetical protein JCM1841_006170 [Sporobolomyces salmonicolor]